MEAFQLYQNPHFLTNGTNKEGESSFSAVLDEKLPVSMLLYIDLYQIVCLEPGGFEI